MSDHEQELRRMRRRRTAIRLGIFAVILLVLLLQAALVAALAFPELRWFDWLGL